MKFAVYKDCGLIRLRDTGRMITHGRAEHVVPRKPQSIHKFRVRLVHSIGVPDDYPGAAAASDHGCKVRVSKDRSLSVQALLHESSMKVKQ